MNTLYVRCQTKDYVLCLLYYYVLYLFILNIDYRYCSCSCWYKVNSVKKDAFPQHTISNAEHKEIFIYILYIKIERTCKTYARPICTYHQCDYLHHTL